MVFTKKFLAVPYKLKDIHFKLSEAMLIINPLSFLKYVCIHKEYMMMDGIVVEYYSLSP